MCELLVRVKSKGCTDPYRDCRLTKRGDVIVTMPDGWGWGKDELTNPDWRIVKVPNVTVAEAAAFTAPELDTDAANPSRVLQRRGFSINLDGIALNAAWSTWIADDTRAAPFRTLSVTLSALLLLKTKKPTLTDPNILG